MSASHSSTLRSILHEHTCEAQLAQPPIPQKEVTHHKEEADHRAPEVPHEEHRGHARSVGRHDAFGWHVAAVFALLLIQDRTHEVRETTHIGIDAEHGQLPSERKASEDVPDLVAGDHEHLVKDKREGNAWMTENGGRRTMSVAFTQSDQFTAHLGCRS